MFYERIKLCPALTHSFTGAQGQSGRQRGALQSRMPGREGGVLGRDRSCCRGWHWRWDLCLRLWGALGAADGSGGFPPGELQGWLILRPCAGHLCTELHDKLQKKDKGGELLRSKQQCQSLCRLWHHFWIAMGRHHLKRS